MNGFRNEPSSPRPDCGNGSYQFRPGSSVPPGGRLPRKLSSTSFEQSRKQMTDSHLQIPLFGAVRTYSLSEGQVLVPSFEFPRERKNAPNKRHRPASGLCLSNGSQNSPPSGESLPADPKPSKKRPELERPHHRQGHLRQRPSPRPSPK